MTKAVKTQKVLAEAEAPAKKMKIYKSFVEEGIVRIVITSSELGKLAKVFYEDGLYRATLTSFSQREDLPEVIEADELEDFLITEEVNIRNKVTYRNLDVTYIGD